MLSYEKYLRTHAEELIDNPECSKEAFKRAEYLYRSEWISYYLLVKFIFGFYSLIFSFVGIILSILGIIFDNIFLLFALIITFIFDSTYFYLHFKSRKRKTPSEKWEFIEEQVKKNNYLYLFDFRVLTRKNWKKLKESKITKKDLSDSQVVGYCYSVCRILANILKDSEIKLVWLGLVKPTDDTYKFGHAVLLRKGYIYDSNLRKTYKFNKYLKAYKGEVFREFSINEYTNSIILQEQWRAFGVWCRERGISRSIED